MPARIHNRGSVLLMAVGLLTIIALLGGAFLIVAGMNRKIAAVFRTQGRMDIVAKSTLLQLSATLAKDAPLSTTPGSTNVKLTIEDMGDATPNDDQFDLWLLPYEPDNPENMRATPPNTRPFPYIAMPQPYVGKMAPSGVKDTAQNEFLVGYRVYDAGAMLNVNYAYKPAKALAGEVMPISDLALNKFVSDSEANTINTGASSPYLVDDFLSFLAGPVPAVTATGRIKQALSAAAFARVGGLLTVRSSSRYSMMQGQTPISQPEKVDLNVATVAELYAAFANMLTGVTSQTTRDAAAVTMAMRVFDFSGRGGPSRSKGTVGANASKWFFGLTRQPFITKAAYHKEADPGKTIYAIELFNPYSSTITMKNCRLSTGGAAFELSIPPHGKAVLAGGLGAGLLKSAVVPISTALDLTKSTAILWGDGGDFPIGRVDPGDFEGTDITTTPVAPTINCETIRRDDRLAKAAYSVAKYVSDSSPLTGDPAVDCATGMGKGNGTVDVGIKPHPVYVRNGKLVNVGDLMRIYYAEVSIGADGSNPMPLDKSLLALDPTVLDNGRLPMFQTTSVVTGFLNNGATPPSFVNNPAVPQGCKATEYFIVKPPMTGTTNFDATNKLVFGQINLNTAPAKVVACLPGLAGWPDAETKASTLLSTGTAGPLTGKPFLTAGHIAKNIGQTSDTAATSFGADDKSAYIVAPDGSDDGLSIAAGEAVFGDLAKQLNAYAWMSNFITVRSDVFVVYVHVQQGLPTGSTATPTVQKYVGVIDRSMVQKSTDKAAVLMFSPFH